MTKAEEKAAIGIIAEGCSRGLPARKIDEKLRAALPKLASHEIDATWSRAARSLQAPKQ
jgi:hypothetical protein